MIRELFINVTILISSLFFYFQILKKDGTTRQSSFRRKLLLGMLTGLLGIILMEFGFLLDQGLLLDFRHIPVMLAAMYAGWLPAVIAAVLIAGYRLILGAGVVAYTAVLMIAVTTAGYLLIARKTRCVYRTILYMLLFHNVLSSIVTYAFFLKGEAFLHVIGPYWLLSFGTGIAAVYLTEYMRKINALFTEYEKNAFIDPLTGLNNVRRFDAAMNEVLAKKGTMSLCIIDIDHFKQVNDTYGHPEGDAILKQLGQLLKEHAMSGTVSRNGGEEFTIILPEYTKASAVQLAEGLRARIEQTPFYIFGGKETIELTVSIGVAAGRDNLYREADQALYQAKQNGRNRVCAAQTLNE